MMPRSPADIENGVGKDACPVCNGQLFGNQCQDCGFQLDDIEKAAESWDRIIDYMTGGDNGGN